MLDPCQGWRGLCQGAVLTHDQSAGMSGGRAAHCVAVAQLTRPVAACKPPCVRSTPEPGQVQQAADALVPHIKPMLGSSGASSSPAKKAKKVGRRAAAPAHKPASSQQKLSSPLRVSATLFAVQMRAACCGQLYRGALRAPASLPHSNGCPICKLPHHAFPLPDTQGFGAKPSGGAAAAGSYQRFSVELPVADTSASATTRLAADVLKRLPGPGPAAWTVVYADAGAAAAAAAAAGQGRALFLRDACRADALGGPLLIVAPSIAEVGTGLGQARGGRHRAQLRAGCSVPAPIDVIPRPAAFSRSCDCWHGYMNTRTPSASHKTAKHPLLTSQPGAFHASHRPTSPTHSPQTPATAPSTGGPGGAARAGGVVGALRGGAQPVVGRGGAPRI